MTDTQHNLAALRSLKHIELSLTILKMFKIVYLLTSLLCNSMEHLFHIFLLMNFKQNSVTLSNFLKEEYCCYGIMLKIIYKYLHLTLMLKGLL